MKCVHGWCGIQNLKTFKLIGMCCSPNHGTFLFLPSSLLHTYNLQKGASSKPHKPKYPPLCFDFGYISFHASAFHWRVWHYDQLPSFIKHDWLIRSAILLTNLMGRRPPAYSKRKERKMLDPIWVRLGPRPLHRGPSFVMSSPRKRRGGQALPENGKFMTAENRRESPEYRQEYDSWRLTVRKLPTGAHRQERCFLLSVGRQEYISDGSSWQSSWGALQTNSWR